MKPKNKGKAYQMRVFMSRKKTHIDGRERRVNV